MKKIKWYYIAIIPLVLYCIYRIVVWLLIFLLVLFGIVWSKTAKVELLYRTDHQKLLNACRNVLGEGCYGSFYIFRNEPNSPHFPKEILELKPNYVNVYDSNFLVIEMAGGMDHFGVIAYAKDFNGPCQRRIDKKLIDGLWYYDEGYRNDPNYEQYIESLRPKK